MIKLRAFNTVLQLAVALTTLVIHTTFAADMSPETIIKARQSNLKDMGGAFKTIRDQLRISKTNMNEVKLAAKQMSDLAQDQNHWFPKGTGPETGIKTAAKTEIWTDAAGFAKVLDKFSVEAPKLLTLANANDIDGLKAQVLVVGQVCKACHDTYRVPEK
jgi:cytochrome c556